MPLPKSKGNTATVELSGGAVEIRGLTWDEIRSLPGSGQNSAHVVALATGLDIAEVEAWISSPEVVAGDVTKLLDAAMDLSGLGEGAQKSE